ncbi:hypothetical protein SPAN111604_10490 [Sphingomonas antarctica]|uniref:BLUF domain-containing protein n=1 Tax=Sphingomonas antarctica TaxID=2040274 RepID=UPI0039E7BA75
MQGPLKSLLYVSRCTAPLDDDQIFRLYKTSVENNAIDGITGVLIHDGNVFLQLLEGGDNAVTAMMARLGRDPRHCAIQVRDERVIEQRSFGTWNMKLLKIDRAHMAAVTNLEDDFGPSVAPEIRQLIIDTLHEISSAD